MRRGDAGPNVWSGVNSELGEKGVKPYLYCFGVIDLFLMHSIPCLRTLQRLALNLNEILEARVVSKAIEASSFHKGGNLST